MADEQEQDVPEVTEVVELNHGQPELSKLNETDKFKRNSSAAILFVYVMAVHWLGNNFWKMLCKR